MSLFFCTVREHVLISLIYMWLSNFPNITCWRKFYLLYILASFVKDWLWLCGFSYGLSILSHCSIYLCANTMLLWLLSLCSSIWSWDDSWASQVHSGKESTCQSWRHKRYVFDLWVRKIPILGYDNPLQYSCLENSMGRRGWRAKVHGVTKS